MRFESDNPTKRIVFTGLDEVTPLGLTAEETWRRALSGESGVRRLRNQDTSERVKIGGEVDPAFEGQVIKYFKGKHYRAIPRFALLGVVPGVGALVDAGLVEIDSIPHSEPSRSFESLLIPRLVGIGGSEIGVEGATAVGGGTYASIVKAIIDDPERGEERISSDAIGMINPNRIKDVLAKLVGARGPGVTVVAACSSGAAAIENAAMRLLLDEELQAMIVVAGDAIVDEIGINTFASMRALSRRNDDPEGAVRVFRDSPERIDGYVVGEGGAAVVLETLAHAQFRKTRIYGELVGVGHTTYPDKDPLPDIKGEEEAFYKAHGKTPSKYPLEAVDLILVHAAGTAGDKIEGDAILKIYGERPAIVADKSRYGHLQGAASLVSAIHGLLAIRDQILPPTLNVVPDEMLYPSLNYVPGIAQKTSVNLVVVNSLGLGGEAVTLLINRYRGD